MAVLIAIMMLMFPAPISIALALAYCLAETYWVQKNIVDAETFTKAARLLPQILTESRVDTFVGGIFTVFGMGSFWQRPS